MTDYTKLVKALRCCTQNPPETCVGCTYNIGNNECAVRGMMCDAAAAIEELQTDIKRLKEVINELREAQTYIDHYGDRWLTSAKDVPTAAYEHGYADGRDEAEAQLSKRGKWIWDDKRCIYVCSVCGLPKVRENMDRQIIKEQAYCYSCGAKMEVQE